MRTELVAIKDFGHGNSLTLKVSADLASPNQEQIKGMHDALNMLMAPYRKQRVAIQEEASAPSECDSDDVM